MARIRRVFQYDPSAPDDGLGEHRKQIQDSVRAHKVAADEAARLRLVYLDQSKQAKELQTERDEAIRSGRAAGMTFVDLEAASGFTRNWIERIVHNRPPQKRNRAGASASAE